MGISVIKVAGGKVRGRSHAAGDTPCQDAFAASAAGDFGCIAVADGAGSRPLSQHGADLVTKQITRLVMRHFATLYGLVTEAPDQAVDLVLAPLLEALRKRAEILQVATDALACTLLFVAYKGGRFVAGHIGDGVIVMRDTGGVHTLSAPDNGEFANVTHFVTDANAKRRLRLYAGEVGDGFGAIVMSDGTAETLFDKRTGQPAPATKRLLFWCETETRQKMTHTILRLNLRQNFGAKTTDDCAIALMTRTPQGATAN